MEGYLNLRISPWIRRLVTRLIAVVPAVLTLFYFGDEKLGELLIFSQVILSLQLGFAVIPLIHFTSHSGLMGKFANPGWVKILAWLSAIIIVGLNIKLVGQEISTFLDSSYAHYTWLRILLYGALLFTAFLLLYVSFNPLISSMKEKRLVPHVPIKKLNLERPANFERIGISVDFSSHDEASIQHAMSLGNKQTVFYLIHVVESAAAKRHGAEVMDIETLQDIDWIESYAKDISEAGFRVEYQLGYGSRANNIAAISEQFNIQLLVMGAHGHKGLKDIIFGSTVNDVRHKLKIPILVVR
jgi:manganese transport protein